MKILFKLAIGRKAGFSSKCTQNRLSAGLRPDPLGELTALPRTPVAGCKGPTSKEREGRRGGEGREREGRGGKGRGGKGGPEASPTHNFWLRHCMVPSVGYYGRL